VIRVPTLIALSAKGTRASYQNFSGNGVAVEALCADLHQYRPVAANKGGVSWTDDIGLEMGPVGDLWVTWFPSDVHR
jgi:hypothetical protein